MTLMATLLVVLFSAVPSFAIDIDLISAICTKAYPDNRDAASTCIANAIIKIVDAESAAKMRAFERALDRQAESQADASRALAAGMILQGFALRPIVPAPLPYTPAPLPSFTPSPLPRTLPPISCSTSYMGAFSQTDCY